MELAIPARNAADRGRSTAKVALAGLAGLFVALHVISPDGVFGEVTYLAVVVLAGVVAVFGARRADAEKRAAWRWIAAGICSSALGDISYSLYVHIRGFEPDISFADIPWLASYVAISIGVLMTLRAARRADRSALDSLIDMTVVGLVAFLVVWQVSLHATLADTSVALNVRVVWAAYPVFDAILVALVVHAAARRAPGALILGAGAACWLVSDFLYMLSPGSLTLSRWLDAGWMTGAAMLAAATLQSPSRRAIRPFAARVGGARIALGIAPLLVPGIIEIVGFAQGDDPNPVPLFGATVLLAFLAFVRAVLILRAAEHARGKLDAAERQFRALVQRSSDTALVLAPDGRILYASGAVQEFGYNPDDLVGQVGWDLVHPDDLANAAEAFSVVTAGAGAHASTELRLRAANGEWLWVEEVVTNLLDEPAVGGLVANIRDISTRKAAEQELSRLAHYDTLTGLPNRWLLTQRLADTLERATDDKLLLVLDLDQFKFVNDSLGHEAGDQLIQAVAARLESSLEATSIIGRIGGDEFAIICSDTSDATAVDPRTTLIQHALADPIVIPGGRSFHVTASVGITIAHAGDTAEHVLQQADTAMYAAKAQGQGQSVVFDDQLRQSAEERLTIQAELRTAIYADQLVVYYQPVINLETGEADGVEALVRWRHPSRGLLLPGEFIPIAEQSDLIDLVGTFVMEQACTDAALWARRGHPLPVAVNLSAAQLRNESITGLVQHALSKSRLDPRLLIVEITETALLLGADRAIKNIEAIRALGVSIALDDFGTGYSSLSFLKRIPADIVKIDQSFVADIEHNSADRDIAAAIIDLARALGRSVIAEGIESEAQHAVLKRLRCPLAQGYLWSPAVPAEDLLPLVATFAKGGQLRTVSGDVAGAVASPIRM